MDTKELIAELRDVAGTSMSSRPSLLLAAASELERLAGIVEQAWKVRTEEKDYTPSPDLGLRASYRTTLHAMLDNWNDARQQDATGR